MWSRQANNLAGNLRLYRSRFCSMQVWARYPSDNFGLDKLFWSQGMRKKAEFVTSNCVSNGWLADYRCVKVNNSAGDEIAGSRMNKRRASIHEKLRGSETEFQKIESQLISKLYCHRGFEITP